MYGRIDYGQAALEGVMMGVGLILLVAAIFTVIAHAPYAISLLSTALRLILIQSWRGVVMLFTGWRLSQASDSFEDESAFAGDESDYESMKASAFDLACAALSLSPEHSSTEFKAAYRMAMRASHPDSGGSKEAAQEVNRNADLIRAVRGWT